MDIFWLAIGTGLGMAIMAGGAMLWFVCATKNWWD